MIERGKWYLYNIKKSENIMEDNDDKLAETTVKEQESVEKKQSQSSRWFYCAIKASNAVACLLGIFASVNGCCYMWKEFGVSLAFDWKEQMLQTIFVMAIGMMSLIFANEAWKEDDKNALTRFKTNLELIKLIDSFIKS